MPDAHGAPRTLRLDLRTRFGPLRGNLAVPPGKMRLAELAWNALALCDRLVSMAEKSEREAGRTVSCRKGCGACCRQAVPVSPAEAWMLADYMAALPAARRGEIEVRFSAAGDGLSSAGFGDRSLRAAGREEMERLGFDYFGLGIPCPFLEEEACSIHGRRPAACREFLAVSPASHCSDPARLPVRNVPMAASLTDALSRTCAAALGGEPTAIPLVLAPAWAEAHAEEGRRTFDAGFLLETFFSILAGDCAGRA